MAAPPALFKAAFLGNRYDLLLLDNVRDKHATLEDRLGTLGAELRVGLTFGDRSREARFLNGLSLVRRNEIGHLSLPIAIHLRDVRDRQHDHGPHAVIECKRVAGNDATLCRRYVVDGIDDRFIGAKYAGGHRTAFMAGYVLSGSIEAAVAGINRYLANRGRAAERLAPCTALPATWTRSSRHPRPSSDPPLIDLHHAFLTCPPRLPR